MTSLNPVYTIGEQIAEAAALPPRPRPPARPLRRAIELLEQVGIPEPAQRLARLSAPALGRHAAAGDDRHGAGLRPAAADRRRADHGARRHRPGADPGAAAASCSASIGMAMCFITHNLGVVAEIADRVAGHVCRPHRREGAGVRALRRAAASLHAGPAALGAAPRLEPATGRARRHPGQRARSRRCRRAAPSRRAARLRRPRRLPRRAAARSRRPAAGIACAAAAGRSSSAMTAPAARRRRPAQALRRRRRLLRARRRRSGAWTASASASPRARSSASSARPARGKTHGRRARAAACIEPDAGASASTAQDIAAAVARGAAPVPPAQCRSSSRTRSRPRIRA